MTDEELTRQVAEEVMGWDAEPYVGWYPLTDPRHWWQVVERMRELGFGLSVEGRKSHYEAAFYKFHSEEDIWVYPKNHPSSPSEIRHINLGRAICEAARAAVRRKK